MKQEKHKYWIDLLRIIAIIMVVLCHSTEEGIYDLTLDSITSMSFRSRIFPFACFAIGRLGVPVFLLITGYLLLDKEYDTETMKRFWKNNWFHLIVCTMIWFLAYDLFLIIVQGKEMSVGDIIQDVLFLNKVQMSHVWYMPMIISIYALIPFAANSLKKMDKPIYTWIPMTFFVFFLFLCPTISICLRIIYPSIRPFSVQMSSGFSGGIYGVYLIFGWLLKKGNFGKIRCYWLIIILLLSCIAAVWIQLWAYKNSIRYNIWYDSPFLLFASICIFELLSRCKIDNKIDRIARWLSSYAFSVYLIHFPIKLYLITYIVNISCRKEFQVIILWGLLLVISLLIANIISMIPHCGNFFLYRKPCKNNYFEQN